MNRRPKTKIARSVFSVLSKMSVGFGRFRSVSGLSIYVVCMKTLSAKETGNNINRPTKKHYISRLSVSGFGRFLVNKPKKPTPKRSVSVGKKTRPKTRPRNHLSVLGFRFTTLPHDTHHIGPLIRKSPPRNRSLVFPGKQKNREPP